MKFVRVGGVYREPHCSALWLVLEVTGHMQHGCTMQRLDIKEIFSGRREDVYDGIRGFWIEVGSVSEEGVVTVVCPWGR